MTIPNPQLSHLKYRPDIDGLRAVAVLSVVAFHAFPSLMKGGFIGVDIFFVISGFLISTIIFEGLDNGIFSFTEFYAKRIKRILPALLLVLVASFTFGWFTLFADEFRQIGKHIVAGAGFVSNVVLWSESGYFDNSAEMKPLLHLWSLGIEEQYYIIWPFLLWLAWRSRFNLFTFTIAGLLVSFILNIKGIKQDPVATFYLPQTRFWELLSGSLLAWFAIHKKNSFDAYSLKIYSRLARDSYIKSVETEGDNPLSDIISLAGSALLIYGFWRITEEVSFPGAWAVIPVIGATLIILAGPSAWANRNILSNKIAVWFGLISFPLYLWHWPLLSFSRIIEGDTPSPSIRIAAVVLSVALAWLTYRFIERPIRFGGHGKAKVAILIALLPIVGLIGYITYKSDGLVFREFTRDNNVFNYNSHWDGWDKCTIVRNSSKNGGCRILERLKPIDLVVIGDSHAGHLASGIKSLNSLKSTNIAVMLYAGCFPSLPVNVNGKEFLTCPDNLISDAIDYAIKTESIKAIVLSGYAALKIQIDRLHEKQNLPDTQVRHNYEILRAGLFKTLGTLSKSQKKVIFVVDNPELIGDPKSCTRRSHNSQCDLRISRQSYLKRNDLYLALIEELKVKFPSVHFTNSIDFFCDTEFCYGGDSDGLWYATRDHLTTHGSRSFVRSFEELFSF